MRPLAVALAFAATLAVAVPAKAQDTDARLPVFDSAQDMRAELDRLMQDLDFVAVV